MADASRGPETSRRGFLKAAALGGAAATLAPRPAPGGEALEPPPRPSPEPVGGAGLLGPEERRALATLADLVLPGAGSWGAAEYVERLLTSFDSDPPRLYAGMMGSGEDWLPMDRVRRYAWRLRIHGSESVAGPNDALLGPVTGLRPAMLEGARQAAAQLGRGASAERVWWGLPSGFRDTFTELVLEGSLGDPVYAGNRDGAAWRAFHFEGAMLGYGTYQPAAHSHADGAAGEQGPDPLGPFTRAALWMLGFFSRRIA